MLEDYIRQAPGSRVLETTGNDRVYERRFFGQECSRKLWIRSVLG